MSTLATVLMVALVVVICAGPPLVNWWLDRLRKPTTLTMHPIASDSFEVGMVLVLDSKPLTVLRVDREKGEVTLG